MGGTILFCATLSAITAAIYGNVSASFVGMAMAYTLLVPIYLNWVVRNVASVEMYMSAVQRVNNYASLPTEDQEPVPIDTVDSGKTNHELPNNPLLDNKNENNENTCIKRPLTRQKSQPCNLKYCGKGDLIDGELCKSLIVRNLFLK